ncbi:integrase catalytic domain-containing protein [Trichonephila clavipes]|nr:integrase catalytic domain-containing protein [Trichonephila clavipes]
MGPKGTPSALPTKLGHLLSGTINTQYNQNSSLICHTLLNIDHSLKQFWELESVPKDIPSKDEDELCKSIFVNSHIRNADGRYILKLPFRDDSSIGDSEEGALKRFYSLERKLHSNNKLKEQYTEFMEEYQNLGHMTPLASDVKSPHYFLPHHGVINDNSSTTKLRVVFDGSFKSTNGNSLNDILLTDDACFQQIFWRKSPEEPLFKLNTVTYGTSCAPFLAIRTLKQLCEDEKHRFPQAAKLAKDHFYVDDLLAGADSVDSARKIAHELQNLMSAGGFELRKWSCTHPEVLSDLPNTLKTNISSHSFDDESTQKILGLFWDLNEDLFKDKLQSLNVFLDSEGILRVGGRLRLQQTLKFEQKHPMLIPKEHHFTSLVIRHFHRVNFHTGQELVLSLIRQQFWIPHGKSAVKKELRNCIDCFKLVAKPVSQMMGDLPIERINPCRAFEKVGIDFAGPITTKCQHTRKANNFKSYICLFICMCTKAVHLELVSSLSAAAFLSALRRFVSRRGYPSDIYSANGSNFVGASAYLKDLFQLLHNSNVQDFSSSKSIQWHFIPPYAPNFGGVWEASVKLTKQHLLKTLKATVLNFEELDTILCQIEACINSRPLYPLSSDPKDLQVLTPGHFLIGCPLLELPDHSLTN